MSSGIKGPITEAPWLAFAAGHWTTDPPTKPGRYILPAGSQWDMLTVRMKRTRLHARLSGERGEFAASSCNVVRWSEPLPEMPPVQAVVREHE